LYIFISRLQGPYEVKRSGGRKSAPIIQLQNYACARLSCSNLERVIIPAVLLRIVGGPLLLQLGVEVVAGIGSGNMVAVPKVLVRIAVSLVELVTSPKHCCLWSRTRRGLP
jgi:hypothetical protein